MTRMHSIRKAPIIHLLSEVSVPDDVISFGQGIPFFPPPQKTVNAAKTVVNHPIGYQYSTDAGMLQLRNVIAEKIKVEHQMLINPRQNCMVTTGANQAFMNVILSITQPGDEIIFFSPTYFNYVMAARLAGCNPVIVQTTDTFQPDVELMKSKITENTQAIVTISPNNPTGAVYSKKILKTINQLCADHSLYHISDEVYEYFVYDDAYHTTPLCFDESLSHTISLFSLSKSFALSGYRIGYMIFPNYLFDDLLKVQDTIGICAPSIAQVAAMNAIPLGRTYCFRFFDDLKNNRKNVIQELSNMPGVHGVWTKGAYYFFVHIDSMISSWNLAKQLIEDYDVIILPGSMFDVDGCSFRLSYGNLSREKIVEGLDRLKNGLTHLI